MIPVHAFHHVNGRRRLSLAHPQARPPGHLKPSIFFLLQDLENVFWSTRVDMVAVRFGIYKGLLTSFS